MDPYLLILLSRIRISIGNADPDPGAENWPKFTNERMNLINSLSKRLLCLGQSLTRIRNKIRIGLAPWIRIRIEVKGWIRIRIETNAVNNTTYKANIFEILRFVYLYYFLMVLKTISAHANSADKIYRTLTYYTNTSLVQCSGSGSESGSGSTGSTCFWASRIRIRIH